MRMLLTDIRYSDFVVNEVGLDGQVIVLKNTKYESHDNPEEGKKIAKVRLGKSTHFSH